MQSGFELVSPCPYPATITITPRAPPIVVFIQPQLGRCWNVFHSSSRKITEFKIRGLRGISTPPMTAVTEFFTQMPRQILKFYWYNDISVRVLPWLYLCLWTQIISLLCSAADAVSSVNWFIVFKSECQMSTILCVLVSVVWSLLFQVCG